MIPRKPSLFAGVTVDHNKLWKILKEMGIPDYLTCLLRNLCAGQKATVRTILLQLLYIINVIYFFKMFSYH